MLPSLTARAHWLARHVQVLADGKHVSKLLGTGSAPAWLRTLPLPAPCLHMNLRLVYSTEWHGWGLDRLYRRCGMAEPLLLLVKVRRAVCACACTCTCTHACVR